MKNLKRDLLAVNKQLDTLSKKSEKMIAAVSKTEKPQPAKSKSTKSAKPKQTQKAKPAKKAPAKKQPQMTAPEFSPAFCTVDLAVS